VKLLFQRRFWKLPWVVTDLEWAADRPPSKEEAQTLKELSMAMKPIAAKKIKSATCHLRSNDGKKDFPQLWMFFAEAKLQGADGEQDRQPGTMWVGVRDGALQVVLKEPSQGLILRVEVESVAALLTVVEAALGAEGSMWEADQYQPKKGRRK
jgi:hypothetical protein